MRWEDYGGLEAGEVVGDRGPDDFEGVIEEALRKMGSSNPLERGKGQAMLDMSKAVRKVWTFNLPQRVEVRWVFEELPARERFYDTLWAIFADKNAVRKGWRKVNGRRSPAATIDWKAWTILGEFLGLKSGHPVDAVAEKFIKAESPDRAVKQLAED